MQEDDSAGGAPSKQMQIGALKLINLISANWQGA
jgi:hypothetical protein